MKDAIESWAVNFTVRVLLLDGIFDGAPEEVRRRLLIIDQLIKLIQLKSIQLVS